MKDDLVNIIFKEQLTEFIIKKPKSTFIARFFLVFFAIIGFFFPIFIVVLAIMNGTEIGFGVLFSFLIGFGGGIYLTRLILWNTYGTEQINISTVGINYFCNYQFFKDNKKQLNFNKLLLDKSTNNIIIKNNDDSIITSIELPEKTINELIHMINNEIEKFKY